MNILQQAARRPILLGAVAVLLCLVVVALLAPWISPGDLDEQDLVMRLHPPGWVDDAGRMHIAGTDNLGRDIFDRLVHGSRITLIVGLLSVAFGGTVGLVLGLISGFYGGWLDAAIMRFTDMQLAFPFFLLALALISILGPGVGNVILVLAATSWIYYAKVIRGDVLLIRSRQYVEAARALGVPDILIILRDILPNVFPSFLVVASFQAAALIIAESSLSYLGLGVPITIPTWGAMLADGREYVTDAWWLSVLPGLAIMFAALSFNILGDGIRDVLDPTERVSRATGRSSGKITDPKEAAEASEPVAAGLAKT